MTAGREQFGCDLGVILKITPVVKALMLFGFWYAWEYWEQFPSRVYAREAGCVAGFGVFLSCVGEGNYSHYSRDCVFRCYINGLSTGVISKLLPKFSRNTPVNRTNRFSEG